MAQRRPSRWLAPLALLAAAVALALVISGKHSTSGSSSSSSSTVTTTTTTGTNASTTKATGRSAGRRTYRVRSGDTLLQVAARTGVPIDRIRALNPSVDANALRVGQILRLRASSP